MRKFRFSIGIGVLLASGVSAAQAADWRLNPKITGSYEYNDNTRMSLESADQIDVSGGAIDAAVEMRADGPRGFFSLVPRLRSSFYPGDATEETDSQWAKMKLRYDWERTRLDVRSDYSRIETLGSYLPGGIGDPGGPIGEPDPGDPTGGRAGARNQEDRFLISPYVSYSIDERHGIRVGGGYVQSNYEERVEEDREDFDYMFGTLGYDYRLSPSKTLRFAIDGGRFEDDTGLTTGTRGLSVEWRNVVSETSEFYARGGAAQSEDDASALDKEWETSFSGGIGVRWDFEVSRVLLDLSTGLDPSASGRLVQRDQLTVQYDRRLTPKLDFISGLRYLRDTGNGSDDDFEERGYANAAVGLAWRFAREWSLGGTYTYVWSEYDDDPSSAEANRVSIGVTWEPNRL